MSNLKYSRLTADGIDAINRLNNIGVEQWRSEFFSPHKPNSFVIQCVDTEIDQKVGCEGYLDYKLIYNGELVQAHRSERTLVSPNYRGQGMFNDLVKCCDEMACAVNSHMSWGSTVALKAFERVGFDGFTGFRNYVFYPVEFSIVEKFCLFRKHFRLLNPLRLLSLKKSRNLEDIRKIFSFLSALKGAKGVERVVGLAVTPIDYTLAQQVISESGRRGDYFIAPQESLMKWLAEKSKVYKEYSLLFNGKYIGHCIYRLDQASCVIHMVDIFCTEPNTLPKILHFIAENEKNSGVTGIFLPLNGKNRTHQEYLNEIKKLGVMSIQKAGSFVIKTLKAGDKITIDKLAVTDLWLEL